MLCLVVAGVQSTWAIKFLGSASHEGNDYYYYSEYEKRYSYDSQSYYNVNYATLVAINATGDVEIPKYFTDNSHGYVVKAVGWLYDQEKAMNVTCDSYMTSLKFNDKVEIHGNFTLSNLYGPFTIYVGKIASDATLNIPHATKFLKTKITIEGTVNAPEIESLTIPRETIVSGTINANSATQTTVEGTVSGAIFTNGATKVDITHSAKVSGWIYASGATQVTIASGATVTGVLGVNNATNVKIRNKSFWGTIRSNQLTSITLGQVDFGIAGKLQCENLRDIYIRDKKALPTFYGNYSDHFSAPVNTITVHVYDMTSKEIADMQNSPVWSGFKEIINHKTEVSYGLAVSGGATVSLLQLKGNANYSQTTNYTQQAQIIIGSKTGTVKGEYNYAVEIKDVNPQAKNVTLWRNGSVVSLNSMTKEGKTVYYYNEPNLQEDVTYEVTITDKTCEFSFTQTGYKGNITYTKTLNGKTSSGVIWGESSTITCSRGSTLELSIPYNQYTPLSLEMNGNVPLTLANGRATATITVPVAETAAATLVWQAPQTTYPHHQPQIMIVRSGEGDVIFKGLRYSSDTDMIEHNEGAIEVGNTNGAWLNLKGDVNCSESVTTITVPDVDASGNWFDEGCWGFRAVMKPVKGQVLKMLLLGHITEEDGRQVLEWEDMLHGSFSTDTLYLKHDALTNTYTLSNMGDYQNFDSGDYILNIAMGPDETIVETGKTINVVRKGGRKNSYLKWYEGESNFDVEEGSSSVLVPNGELEYDDMSLVIGVEEGETFHVYKNGADITSQFHNSWSPIYYQASLDTESATYTVHIDGAPDANPVWNVHQHGGIEGTQIVVSRTGQDDEVLVCDNAVNELTIDDSDVTKVTLNVPVSTEEKSTPLLVLKNGADVSYQFKGYADGMLTYEVPNATLYDTNWDISYDLSHQQTFVVSGGTKENVLMIEKEYMNNSDTINVAPNGLASFYLAPLDNTYNRYFYLTIYVNEGETLRVLRNGVDVTDKFGLINEPGVAKYYELDADNAGFEGREAATWHIIINEAEEVITWSAIAVGDVPQGASAEFIIDEDSDTPMDIEVDNATSNGSGTYLNNQLPPDIQLYVRVPAGYQFKVWFNGEEYTNRFWLYSTSNEGVQSWSYYTSDTEGITPLAVDGTWVVEFKEAEGGITWSAMAIGDVAEGNRMVATCYDTMLDVGVQNGHQYDTLTYAPQDEAANMSTSVIVKEGYNFRVWFNDMECTDKFVNPSTLSDGRVSWTFSSSDPSVVTPYLQDGRWIILFYDDVDRYDVNRDGTISIADVTTLVNKILGKD